MSLGNTFFSEFIGNQLFWVKQQLTFDKALHDSFAVGRCNSLPKDCGGNITFGQLIDQTKLASLRNRFRSDFNGTPIHQILGSFRGLITNSIYAILLKPLNDAKTGVAEGRRFTRIFNS